MTAAGDVHPPTHPAFVIGLITQDRQNRVTRESLALKWMMSLKSAADTIKFTTQKVMRMATGPLMRRYKLNIAPFTKYRQLKATFYIDPLYGKVPSMLGNKLAQVFTSGDFIFVAPMKSKADRGLGLMDLCDEHGIPAELRYDNAKKEIMPGTMMQRVMKNFYIIGRSAEPYTQQQNKCEGQFREWQYQSKRRMVKTNAPASLWDFCIVNESDPPCTWNE